jgi:hypothetical protein
MTSLPYAFDTTSAWRWIITLALWLEVIVLGGILYAGLVNRNLTDVFVLTAIGLVGAGIGVVMYRNVTGSTGTITRDEVIVERGRAGLGVRFPGPEGRFPMRQFVRVRVEQSTGPVDADIDGGPHTDIYLIGDPFTPTILVASVSGDGQIEGRDLGAALNLPVESKPARFLAG